MLTRLLNTHKRTTRHFGIPLLLLILSLCASGQVLRGTVINGTNNKPAAGDDVTLLKLDRGMEAEATTKTNAKGEFSFTFPDQNLPHVVRVRHNNVNYHEPAFPGTATVTVRVYNSAERVQGISRIDQSVVVLQAQPDGLRFAEIFTVKNDSQPPMTQPSFDFYLPEGATILSGDAMRAGAMPLKSAPVPQGEKNRYAFQYPLVPGQTHFEVEYSVPYSGTFKFQPKFAAPVEKFYVITPKTIGFGPQSTSKYQTVDQWPIDADVKGVDVHLVNNVNGTDTQLAFDIAGNGVLPQTQSPPQQGGAPAGQGSSAQDQEVARPGGGLGPPNERPNPLSAGQGWFILVLTFFLAGGAVFLFVTARWASMTPATPQGQSTALLDALKEEMFQLESDRLQSKIGQQEYDTAKAALDKTLQRAMKRKA
jgi:hypothetical protein